jgi:uncharacterized protein YcfJ
MIAKSKKICQILITTGLVFAPLLSATAGGFIDNARVTHVEPIVKYINVDKPRTECWDESVYRPGRKHHSGASHTPTILGAIVGSAIGHQFGHGPGRHVAAVAGAVLGGSIGGDIQRHHRRHNKQGGRYVNEQRCETVNDVVTEQQVVAYRVTYRYKGQPFTTRMQYHPGDTIRVRVGVTPIS